MTADAITSRHPDVASANSRHGRSTIACSPAVLMGLSAFSEQLTAGTWLLLQAESTTILDPRGIIKISGSKIRTNQESVLNTDGFICLLVMPRFISRPKGAALGDLV